MRIPRGLFFSVTVALLCIRSAPAESPGPWQPELDSARRLAAQTNRLVLVYFYADWCQVCRAMEQDLAAHPRVLADLQADFVLVKVNADFFPATAKQYGVTALPTTVITTAQGQFVDALRGRSEATQYAARLRQVATAAQRPEGRPGAQIPPARPVAASPRADLPGDGPPRSSAARPPRSDDRYADFFNQQQPASPSATAPPGYPPYGEPAVGSFPVTAPPGSTPRTIPPPPGHTPPRDVPPASVPPAVPPSGPPNTVAWPGPWPGPGTAGPSPTGNAGVARGPTASPPGTAMPPGAPPGSPISPASPAAPPTGPAAAPPPSSPATVSPLASPPPGNPPLGLEGYCPVCLVEKQQWVLANRQWGVIHRGRTYLFAGQEERDRFWTDPDRYAPVISGNDAVLAIETGQAVPGSRKHGVFYGNRENLRVYLFADEASLQKFSRNPGHYATQVFQAMRSGANPGQQIR